MRTKRVLVVICASVLLAALSAGAQVQPSRPGSFLIVPDIGTRVDAETFVGFANDSEEDVDLFVAFVRGSDCLPCELSLPLPAWGSRTLVISRDEESEVVGLLDLDGGAGVTCPAGAGFMTAHAESSTGESLYDDSLIGSATVVEYDRGTTRTIPAIAIQRGPDGGDGSRRFVFDGEELLALPDRLTAAFFVPDTTLTEDPGGVETVMTLVSPTLEAESTICDLTIRDRSGVEIFPEPLGVEFSCWSRIDLEMLEDSLGFPNFAEDSATLEVACRRDVPGSSEPLRGGVVGSLTQKVRADSVLRRNDSGQRFSGRASWAGLLEQSIEVGDPVRLNLGDDTCPGVSNPDQTDTDGDGAGDACDFDDDGDGVADPDDSAPLDPTICRDDDADTCDDCSSGAGVDVNNDGPDFDSDRVCDPGDNCPAIFNPAQFDSNANGVGDACEPVEGVTRPRAKPLPSAIPDRRRGI